MKRHSNLLERLGVDRVKTLWDRSPPGRHMPFRNAVQAAAVALAVGSLAMSPESVEFSRVLAAASSPASIEYIVHDGRAPAITRMTLLLDRQNQPQYIPSSDVSLNKRFASELQLELERTVHSADSGFWDAALTGRIVRLQNSPLPIDRQVANAVLQYIQRAREVPASQLPHPSYYLAKHAHQIESDRQTFVLVDAAVGALRKHSGSLDAPGVIDALNQAGLPGALIAAHHGILRASENEPLNLHGDLLVADILRHEDLRISALYHAGAYLGHRDLTTSANEGFNWLISKLDQPYQPRKASASTADRDRDFQALTRNTTHELPAQSRFPLTASDGIRGNGMLLEDLGLADPARMDNLPKWRIPAGSIISADLVLTDDDPAPDFRASM